MTISESEMVSPVLKSCESWGADGEGFVVPFAANNFDDVAGQLAALVRVQIPRDTKGDADEQQRQKQRNAQGL